MNDRQLSSKRLKPAGRARCRRSSASCREVKAMLRTSAHYRWRYGHEAISTMDVLTMDQTLPTCQPTHREGRFQKSANLCTELLLAGLWGGLVNRTAAIDWVHKLGSPLYTCINQSKAHPLGLFSQVRASALAVAAHLAYCAIGDQERGDVERATIIPCHAFHTLRPVTSFELAAAFGPLDFPEAFVVRTNRFVALGLPTNDELLIGVRGTVGAFDWSLNARIWPRRSASLSLPMYFHSGFLSEAELLASHLSQAINSHRKYASIKRVFLAGHSLGGAIASILHQRREIFTPHLPGQGYAPGDCYIFGAPRTNWRYGSAFLDQAFAVRRAEDIVPRTPPATLGYENFVRQSAVDGTAFRDRGLVDLRPFLRWIDTMRFSKFLKGHAMETYRREVLLAACRHPDLQPYWHNSFND